MPDEPQRSLADAVAALKRDHKVREKATAPVKEKRETRRKPRQFLSDLAPPAPEKRGRPSIYTDDIAHEICWRVKGGESLREICREPGLPEHQTVYEWLDDNPTFSTMYVRARARQAEAMAERGLLYATTATPESVGVHRLAFDSMRWMAGQLDPARWSEKAQLQVNVVDPAADERKKALRAELIASLQGMARAEPLPVTIDAKAEPEG